LLNIGSHSNNAAWATCRLPLRPHATWLKEQLHK
jgi:hypothetical protein